MSYIYSRALVEEFLEANCSDTDASALLNESHTHKPSWWHDKTMEPSRHSRFGMTCALLTDGRGEALLMSFAEAFRAKTSAPREGVAESTASDPAFGGKWPASSVKYDRDSSSWKTAHCLWEEVLPWSSVTLPTWGMTRSGFVYRHPTAERPISVTGAGLWPTPTVCGNYNRKGLSATSGDGLATYVAKFATPQARDFRSGSKSRWDDPARSRNLNDQIATSAESGRLNPDWVEWLMGWPIGHTALKPLETGRYREWLQQHSPCF